MKKRNLEIPANWKLPELLLCRLGSKAGKQRVIAEDGHVLVVLHKIPKQHDKQRQSVFLWRQPDGKWLSSERGNGIEILNEHIEEYAKAEGSFDEGYDSATSASDYFTLLESISPVQRAVKNMNNTLQNAREVIGPELIDYRDKVESLQRNFDLLYEDCKNGLEYAIAKKAEEQSELQKEALVVGHRLNIIMALFLPITAIASLLGMNVSNGLESSSAWVFGIIVCICAVLGVLMKYWVTKR